MPRAFIGAGGNLGDRRARLAAAVRGLDAAPRTRVVAVSAVYETAPVGVVTQPDFLNLVCAVETALDPRRLLAECRRIEAEQGRVRRERWGPRTLDLDLLMFDNVVWADADLTLPHPRMAERTFVLVPLAELAGERWLGGETVAVRAARLGTAGLRRLGPLEWREPEPGAGPRN